MEDKRQRYIGMRAQQAVEDLLGEGIARIHCIRYQGHRAFGADRLLVTQVREGAGCVELLLCPFKTEIE